MKKFIIGMTGIALCVCLTACGKSAGASSVSNLCNQLDSTANALSSIRSVSPTEIGISKTNNSGELYQDSQLTGQTLLNEQYYKTEILDRTATLKNSLDNITLSKMQKSAINDLTNTLNKYTSAIQNSKYEMNSCAKAITSMKKNVDKNEEKLKAKFNRLACNSNMRSAYYENILSTLDEIENCLNLSSCQDCTKAEPVTEVEQKSNAQTALKKNIDTYQNVDDDTQNTDGNTTDDPMPNQNFRRGTFRNPNHGNTIYNRFGRFNPSRNTDTYGPNRRNIDSFGGFEGVGYNGYGYNNGYGYGGTPYANNGYGYGNNFYAGSNYGNRLTAPMPVAPMTYASAKKTPEKRLETFEKTNPSGTVEKIENDEKDLQKSESDITTSAAAITPTTLRRKVENEKNQLDRKVVAH